jgi:biotin carboxyl carrier protein
MRYYVTFDPSSDAKPTLVDVVELPSGALQVKVDERLVEVDAVSVGSQLSVRVGGQMVDLTTEGTPPDLGAVANGHRAFVRVESERMRAAERAKRGSPSGGEKLTKSPMPGRVVKVLVAKGDVVVAGQGLVVLEAMKMENEVRTRTAGKVAEVHVTAGATVEGNAKLVTLE